MERIIAKEYQGRSFIAGRAPQPKQLTIESRDSWPDSDGSDSELNNQAINTCDLIKKELMFGGSLLDKSPSKHDVNGALDTSITEDEVAIDLDQLRILGGNINKIDEFNDISENPILFATIDDDAESDAKLDESVEITGNPALFADSDEDEASPDEFVELSGNPALFADSDEDEASPDEFVELSGNPALFADDDHEDENDINISNQTKTYTSPIRKQKTGLEITPNRPTNLVMTSPETSNKAQLSQDGVITIGTETIYTPDFKQHPAKLNQIGAGGAAQVFKIESPLEIKDENNKPLNLVVKKMSSYDTEMKNENLLRTLNPNFCMTPVGNIEGTEGIIYSEAWGDLTKFTERLDWSSMTPTTANQFLSFVSFHLFNACSDFHMRTGKCLRDIKPENILLSKNNRTGMFLNDYGSMGTENSPRAAITPIFVYSEYYDQKADRELTYKADYYSLALTLVEFAFKQLAFNLFNITLTEDNLSDRITLFNLLNNETLMLNNLKSDHLAQYHKLKPTLSIITPLLNPNVDERTQHSQLIIQLNEQLTGHDHEMIATIFDQTKNI